MDLRVLLGNAAMTPTTPARPARFGKVGRRGPSAKTLDYLEQMPARFTASEWVALTGSDSSNVHRTLARLIEYGALRASGRGHYQKRQS